MHGKKEAIATERWLSKQELKESLSRDIEMFSRSGQAAQAAQLYA